MAEKLAIYGGPKAKTTPNYPMYPGGLEIGEAEKKEVMEVLDNKYLFRYYGPEGVESKVRKFEEHFKAKMGREALSGDQLLHGCAAVCADGLRASAPATSAS